ncbi:MAG TPA: EscU/YscU/HrcU family type III secretion system export apparatus switch protein [Steroidobacteraceae bacterium]
MAGPQRELDANEPATPFKLDKARERGSIFRSADLVFAVILLVCVACVQGLGLKVIDGLGEMMRNGLALAGHDKLTQAIALKYAGILASQMVTVAAPLVFSVWVAALLCSALQAGGVFSAEPLKPDFGKLNPANGLKRIFSIRSLHEVWRSGARLTVVAIAMWSWGRYHLADLLRLQFGSSQSMQHSGVRLLGSVLALLAGIMVLFALLDWSFNRWEYLRQMRMSRREMREELKEREGDPRIKSKHRQLRIEWLKRMRQLSKVRSADVLLTNPTHVAVALEYRHGEMPAPMITARAAGELAHRMRVEARRRSVPIVEYPQLARALFALSDSQQFVPEEHFEPVAKILRWVFAARRQRFPASEVR